MEFDFQPVLEGPRLRLRPLRNDDFDALYSVASDPELWTPHPDPERYRRDRFQVFFDDALTSEATLVVVDRNKNRIVGSSRYRAHPENHEIEIGWTFLAGDCWGGRYNAELKRLMLEHAFRFVDRVIFLVGPNNHRSRRAVENIGAVPNGRQANAAGHEHLRYELTAADFPAQQDES